MIFAIRDLRGVTATEKLVLFALASHLPNIRVGQTRLAEETGVSRETISRCIRTLVAKKIIEKEEGKNRILNINFLLQQDPRVVTQDHNSCDGGSQLVVTENHIKNQIKIQDKNINKKEKKYAEEFEEFYKKYPEKKGKKEVARKRFVQARKSGTPFEKIMHDLEAYITSKPEWQNFAYCPSWFGQMMDGKEWREDVYGDVVIAKQKTAVQRLKDHWARYGNISEQPWATEQTIASEERTIKEAFEKATAEEREELIELAPKGARLPTNNVVALGAKPTMRVVQ